MNTKYLTAFLTAVDEGSINLAAARLFLSPSALMKQLNSVEEEVGTPLLTRGKKGIGLTEAGKVFYDGLRAIHPVYEELVRKTRAVGLRSTKGLVIGSWSVACHSVLPAIVNYYRIQHPEVELGFRNISSIADMQGALERKEIDATFSFGGRSRATARLREVTLAREEPLLLIPPTCELPIRRVNTLEDFRGQTLVVTDGSISGWFDHFNRYVEQHYPDIRLYKSMENESGLMEMQKLAAPCVASRSIVPRDSSYVAVPLQLPEDFGEPLISIDLLCRSEDDPLVEEFIRAASDAAKIIWFSR